MAQNTPNLFSLSQIVSSNHCAVELDSYLGLIACFKTPKQARTFSKKLNEFLKSAYEEVLEEDYPDEVEQNGTTSQT